MRGVVFFPHIFVNQLVGAVDMFVASNEENYGHYGHHDDNKRDVEARIG